MSPRWSSPVPGRNLGIVLPVYVEVCGRRRVVGSTAVEQGSSKTFSGILLETNPTEHDTGKGFGQRRGSCYLMRLTGLTPVRGWGPWSQILLSLRSEGFLSVFYQGSSSPPCLRPIHFCRLQVPSEFVKFSRLVD